MDTTEVKGKWDEQKIRLKEKYDFLEDSDLVYEEGKQNEMFIRLQIKLGKTRDELQALIATL